MKWCYFLTALFFFLWKLQIVSCNYCNLGIRILNVVLGLCLWEVVWVVWLCSPKDRSFFFLNRTIILQIWKQQIGTHFQTLSRRAWEVTFVKKSGNCLSSGIFLSDNKCHCRLGRKQLFTHCFKSLIRLVWKNVSSCTHCDGIIWFCDWTKHFLKQFWLVQHFMAAEVVKSVVHREETQFGVGRRLSICYPLLSPYW